MLQRKGSMKTAMSAGRQRMVVLYLAVAIGTAVGALTGYVSGRVVTLKQSQTRLDASAQRLIEDAAASIRESRGALAQMNASQLPFCSEAQIREFRRLIFYSYGLKDAGRIVDGKIVCSTTLGATPASQATLRPDFMQHDGALIYRNPPMFPVDGHTVIVVQMGSSYVVYSPYRDSPILGPRMHFAATDIDHATHTPGRLYGEQPPIDGTLLVRNGFGVAEGTLFATRCPAVGSLCTTTFTSISEALGGNRPGLLLFTLLGALAGGLLGVVSCLVYCRRISMEQRLQRAIRANRLRVEYQPIVDLGSGAIVEAEALVRWTDDDGRAIGPDVFVEIAEDRGFVGEITRLVVHRALKDFAETLRARPNFRVNVNIAAHDLADPGFLPMLDQALREAGVRPENLCVEITESFTARQQAAMETIQRLRERGHSVYIDDFGTGYSSLSYLHDLSVDAIKIDKAFTRAIGTDAVTVSILPQILAMARQLGLRVIVEGIETPEQAGYFAGAGHSILAQGWLFGRPTPPEAFLQLLNRTEPTAESEVPVPRKAPQSVHVPAGQMLRAAALRSR